MRAESNKSAANRWANVDVNYTSSIWDDCVAASEVFIIPTVITGQGTRLLLTIAENGTQHVRAIGRELEYKANIIKQRETYTKLQCICNILRIPNGESFITEEQILTEVNQASRSVEAQAAINHHCVTFAEHMLARFAQLHNVAQRVLGEQEERGDQLMNTEEGVKKLTVGIKCLDNIWADITRSWESLHKALQELDRIMLAWKPLAGAGPGVAEIENDEEAKGDGERERQQILIFDPTESGLERRLRLLQFERATDVGDEQLDIPLLGTSASREESEFAEAFKKRCEISGAAVGDAGKGNVPLSPPDHAEGKAAQANGAGPGLPDQLPDEQTMGTGAKRVAKVMARTAIAALAESEDD
ncbi:uncharacterized protein Z518_08478 [Rhinocladiella mackenziei CBS 650.93]|uniref:Uncharacterized protein n=1 Tax=Rhinocladiella mackenziei CBS 650.93 TaxID=1442369 RepID=A0A0D2FKU5_9EURO|nr:uncharacterized protein Z518_08478 [Rhinocladiella mackenziei CBS 650.93]KIX02537.1 hypothetical protein Z518_08478 [Rhinocladiella mackenziei CBS 650.93]